MKFEMNGCVWVIKEVAQEEIKKEMENRYNRHIEGEVSSDGRYLGITYHDTQIIYLDEELPIDRKKKTLLHELTHCYIGSYITFTEKTYCEEDICDIVSNSYEIIQNIINNYFNVDKKKN